MPIFLQMSGHAIQIQIPIFPFERDVCNIKKKIYVSVSYVSNRKYSMRKMGQNFCDHDFY